MNYYKILNISALVISMLGTFLMFYYSSKVDSRLFFYQEGEYKDMHRKDNRKNKMIRFGMLLLFIGFSLQLISMLL